MKILLIEYAVGTGDKGIIKEGRAMLKTLAHNFTALGHQVYYPAKEEERIPGIAVRGEFFRTVEKLSERCDAALVIAPERDDILYELTSIIEDGTVNLGSPPNAVKNCSDKLKTTNILLSNEIKAPEVIDEEEWINKKEKKFVLKPRFGCGSKGVMVVSDPQTKKEGLILTRYIEGEHISTSLIVGEDEVLPLTVNEQLTSIDGGINYLGGIVPYRTERWNEIMSISVETARIMGCRGYVGIDIILSDEPYIVDVNPRPTTSIIGIDKAINFELADLILRGKFGGLPPKVEIRGEHKFLLEEFD
ncbi:MAG: Tetrahydromethanopterin:alpha-L-glutamate ligase [Candidatus Methanolliviera sp. GoM_asphalt]|nr:MAG: Tetrahydromethanopterin:alpha-L-glutamate ligase [Candidatus Methanolliviera sp. GoM_asphalt]